MKIQEIRCVPVQAPGRTLVVVVVTTDNGLIGLGEAGLQRRWKALAGVLEHFNCFLRGRDPRQIERLWQEMFRGGFYPADRVIGSLLSAIDIALWDIKAKSLGVPVYELLGGLCREHVECFFHPGYDLPSPQEPGLLRVREGGGPCTPADAADLARRYVERGLRYIRFSPPADGSRFFARKAVRLLAEQLVAVRDAVGDRLELMVDLHTRLDPEQAIWFCSLCEPLGVFVVEDPIRSEHAAGYRRIRQQTRVPLAAGEQWSNKWEFRQAIEEELIDYARADLCIAGGLTEGKKIAALAETHFVKLLLHNPLGPICTAASLHLDLACDNAGPQEVLWPPQSFLPDIFDTDFRLENGVLTCPPTPGLGVRFNEEAARSYPPEMTEPPRWTREDGSFTNY